MKKERGLSVSIYLSHSDLKKLREIMCCLKFHKKSEVVQYLITQEYKSLKQQNRS